MARIEDIITIASRMTGAPVSHIKGDNHSRNICAVRAGIYIIARESDYSFSQIARSVGDRDHTTVINGIDAARRYALAYPHFDDFLATLRQYAAECAPFISDTGWRPSTRFDFGSFDGTGPHLTRAKRVRKPVRVRACNNVTPLRDVFDRNDFATDGDFEYGIRLRDMAQGSRELAAAIQRARAAWPRRLNRCAQA